MTQPAFDAQRPTVSQHARTTAEPAASEAIEALPGRIAAWLPNPNGDVDGVLLDDGAQVSFAPMSCDALRALIHLHDAVLIDGVRRQPSGTLRATGMRDARNGRSLLKEARDEPRPPGAAPEPAALNAMNASGRIAALLRTERGDVGGVLLERGTVVRFPPHAIASLTAPMRPGASFYARGYGTRLACGDAFEATRIGSSEDDAQDIFRPPGHPPPATRRPPGPPASGGAAR